MRRKEREIRDTDELETVISRCDVCRIALADENNPYIVTMNFGYSGGAEKKIFFHSAREGKKIDMIRKNNFVCFEFDTDHELKRGKKACDFGMKYSSVIGWGYIFIVNDSEEKIKGLNSIMQHYAGRQRLNYDEALLEKTVVLKILIDTMTGKKA